MSTDGLRPVRALALGVAMLLLTVVGHAAGQGAIPGPDGLGIAAVLSFAFATAVSSRRVPLVRLVLVLVGSQIVLHVVLDTTAHHATWPPTTAMVVGHACSAVLAALVIWRGEECVARWLAYLAQAIGRHCAPVELPRSTATATHVTSLTRPARYLHYILVRRGPPVADFA